jgi:CheY-like chemotaxis protein
VIPVRSAAAATKTLEAIRPSAIVLDVRLHGDESWNLLTRLKRQRPTADIPILVVSSVDDPHKAMALGASAYHEKPVDAEWLLATLDEHVRRTNARRVLVIDDQDTARFIIREMLRGDYEIFESAGGRDAVRQARRLRPSAVLLDLHLGDADGLDVRDDLRHDAVTADLPVVVVTSRTVTSSTRDRLGSDTPVLSKADLTREHLRLELDRAIGAHHTGPEGRE